MSGPGNGFVGTDAFDSYEQYVADMMEAYQREYELLMAVSVQAENGESPHDIAEWYNEESTLKETLSEVKDRAFRD